MAIATAVPAGSPVDGTLAQVPSPLQNVEEEALVPLFKLVTGRSPVTPVVKGNPVASVKLQAGVASAAPRLTVTPPKSKDELASEELGTLLNPSCIVPEDVIGDPESTSIPSVPDTATLVTVPPDGIASDCQPFVVSYVKTSPSEGDIDA